MKGPIEASGRISEAEVFRVMRAEGWRRTRVAAALCAAVFLIIESAMLYLAMRRGFTANALADLALLPAVFLIMSGLFLFSVRRAAHRIVESPELVVGGLTVTFDEEQIVMRSALSSSESAWEALYGARETRDALLLYRSKDAYHVVLKRMLSSPDNVSALRELIRSKLGSKARLF
jgi:hypothetical protein